MQKLSSSIQKLSWSIQFINREYNKQKNQNHIFVKIRLSCMVMKSLKLIESGWSVPLLECICCHPNIMCRFLIYLSVVQRHDISCRVTQWLLCRVQNGYKSIEERLWDRDILFKHRPCHLKTSSTTNVKTFQAMPTFAMLEMWWLLPWIFHVKCTARVF